MMPKKKFVFWNRVWPPSNSRNFNKGILSFLILLLFSHSIQSQNIFTRADRSIVTDLMSDRTLSGVHFFRAISNTAGTISIAVPALIAIKGFVKNDSHGKLDAVYMFESLGIAFLVTEGLKYSVNRERPFKTLPGVTAAIDAGGPSFPSGHSSNAFALATSLCILYPRWYVMAPALVWAGTVSYSRVYLGVHYPSDVLAGAIVGAGSAYLAYKLNRILFRSKTNLKKNLDLLR